MHFVSLDTPLGKLGVFEQNEKIIRVSFSFCENDTKLQPSCVAQNAAEQLHEYFLGKRKTFDLPISLVGVTPFRKEVYTQLMKVEYGKTVSYKDIATAISNPGAVRAVGGALNKNPLLIIVPCHRVVGADGSLTGFACGIDKKQFLLKLEKNSNQF